MSEAAVTEQPAAASHVVIGKLAAEFKLKRSEVEAILAAANVSPSLMVPMGPKKTMRLYGEPARAAIQAELDRRAAAARDAEELRRKEILEAATKLAAESDRKIAAVAKTDTVDLSKLVDQCSRILGDLADLRQMVQELTGKVGSISCSALPYAQRGAQEVPAATKVADVAAPGPMPRICIVGLLPAQEQMMRSEFAGLVSLEFVATAKAADGRLRALAKTVDAVIMMAGFASHAVGEIVKSRGGKLITSHGGITRLREVLTEISVNGLEKF